MTTFLLVRHASSRIERTQPRTEWPLSASGADDATHLAAALQAERVDAVYASPYARAVQTVAPLAAMRGLDVDIDAGLGERIVSDGYIDDWDAVMESSWADFDFCTAGGESNRECQLRIEQTLQTIARRHRADTVVIGTHGIVLALFFCTFSSFTYEQWQAMPEPALYRVAASVDEHGNVAWRRLSSDAPPNRKWPDA